MAKQKKKARRVQQSKVRRGAVPDARRPARGANNKPSGRIAILTKHKKLSASPPLPATDKKPPDKAARIPHDTPVPSPQRPRHGPPIVGLGASAGGLEAMESFFRHMPANSDLAFVVVTHQMPGHTSVLPEILSKHTAMSVTAAQDCQKVEPNCVYVAPPGSDVALLDGTLRLTEPPPTRGPTLPIDFFFRSLAEDRQGKAVGIVLSGNGSDGTCGVRAIKGESGMVMVQKPTSAKFSGMPESAIATGLVDFVLDVPEMPDHLLGYTRGPYLSTPPEAQAATALSPEAMRKIFALLRSRTGNSFACYKTNTVRRRIERRMAIHQFHRVQGYIDYLEENPHEIDLLFQELLIGVTNFFRDSEAFAALCEALPDLLRNRSGKDPLRAWVAGCSTGEEAYSLAIVLRECAEHLEEDLPIQVFGTDLDKSAIESARTGSYPEGIAVDVSPKRLARFFETRDHGFQVKKELRDMVVFAPQNVITDPPFTKVDLIACRNLLIYLDTEAQKRILPMFHYALRPGGLLFLGSSEGIGGSDGLFSAVDKKWKIYRRQPGPTSTANLDHFPLVVGRDHPPKGTPEGLHAQESRRPGLAELIEKDLLRKYAPASVTVNERGDIFYIHGRTGMYLEPAAGQPSHNVLQMAREGLRLELASALRRAAAQHKEVRRGPVHVKTNGDYVAVNFVVRPVTEPEPVRGLFVIDFDPERNSKSASAKPGRPLPRAAGRILELENELVRSNESLQSSIEEVETTNEELKSANEELQSTNEELQSANEELETSREEMQSLNEELQTVNVELQTKIESLSRANDDMKNLLDNTDIGMIFLDNALNIKRFTEHARKVIHLIPTDLGRPISDIASNLTYDALIRDSTAVLRTLVPKETEVQTHDGAWYLVRIVPYRAADNVIDGLVITLVDVSRIKRAESAARRLAQIVESAEHAIVGQDLGGIIGTWNPAAVQVYGYAPEEIIGRPFVQLVPTEKANEYESIRTCVSRGDSVTDWKTTRRRKDGRQIAVNVTVFPIRDDTGRVIGVTSMARPIPAPAAERDGTPADDSADAAPRSKAGPLS